MTSQFLEDLTRAGSAVWEQYLAPFAGGQAQIPPAFPEWGRIPELDEFRTKYGYTYDWRLWMAWATGFSFLATSIAVASDRPEDFDALHKFAELAAIHMGDRCPGMHEETGTMTREDLRDMPTYPAPVWNYGSYLGQIDQFRFEMAAYQGWLTLEASLVPENRPSDKRLNEIMMLGSELEEKLFSHTKMSTLMGLMVLAMHMATLAQKSLRIQAQLRAADRTLCVVAHGNVDTIRHYLMQYHGVRSMAILFRNAELN